MRERMADGRWWRRGAVCGVVLCGAAMLAGAVHGQEDREERGRAEDRVGMFSTIEVTRARPAADVACMFCTVQIDGDVRGDVAVLFGTVSVGDEQTVAGDVAMMFSTLRVGEDARINGDLATLFSTTSLAPSARVRGDRAMVASGLGLAVLLGPVLIAVGLVWLLAWGLRRTLL